MSLTRLTSLTQLYLSGALSSGEENELYTLLLTSPSSREQFDRIVAAHNQQQPDSALPCATEFLESYVPGHEVIPLTTSDDATTPDLFSMFRSSMSAWRYWSLGGALAACSIAALIIAVQPPSRPFRAPAPVNVGPVAKLSHAAGVQWIGRTNEPVAGETLGAGELAIARGVLELQFQRGAKLVLEGPAKLQLVSDNEAFLHSGKITAEVPGSAHGFTVTAPKVSVKDLGTEFGVLARSNAAAEVHVFSGLVEMTAASRAPKRMEQGRAARIGRFVRGTRANRSAFVFSEDVIALETAEQQERHARWKSSAAALSSDPATLVHYTFEDQSETDVRLLNQAVNGPRVSEGILAGTWGTGRWPAKGAFAFASKADRIRFQVPNTLTSLTYMATLRVDKLTSVSNALAITEGNQLGEVHWQIYRDGRVALSARSGKNGSVDETWDRGLSPPLFTSNQLGRWVQLTSVYDSEEGTIRHYLDGNWVSTTPIKRPVRLKLQAVEIGNWGVRLDEPKWAHLKSSGPNYLNRHWSGSIDEFALLARAMTPDEIREYYRRGRASAGTVLAQGK